MILITFNREVKSGEWLEVRRRKVVSLGNQRCCLTRDSEFHKLLQSWITLQCDCLMLWKVFKNFFRILWNRKRKATQGNLSSPQFYLSQKSGGFTRFPPGLSPGCICSLCDRSLWGNNDLWMLPENSSDLPHKVYTVQPASGRNEYQEQLGKLIKESDKN